MAISHIVLSKLACSSSWYLMKGRREGRREGGMDGWKWGGGESTDAMMRVRWSFMLALVAHTAAAAACFLWITVRGWGRSCVVGWWATFIESFFRGICQSGDIVGWKEIHLGRLATLPLRTPTIGMVSKPTTFREHQLQPEHSATRNNSNSIRTNPWLSTLKSWI